MKLKPLNEQVIVITGATSGIGLVTARHAAKAGAKLVLAARSQAALTELAGEINAQDGDAVYVIADVSEEADVQKIADTAIQTFGRFDTWVNNVGVGMYGKVMDIPVSDMKPLFDTNLWSQVYGSQVAVRHLRTNGGALINVGSTVSERAIPLQGVYSATKHAVKAFTDALRMELESENAPVSVTLIKPGPIDTPFPINAKNYLESEPKHVPPVYAPEAVAEAILHAATHPIRDIYVGFGAAGNAALGNNAPGLADKAGVGIFIPNTHSDNPAHAKNSLDAPTESLRERGNYAGAVHEKSLYTEAILHPALVGAVAVGAGVLIAAIANAAKKNGGSAGRINSAAQPIYTAVNETAPHRYTVEAGTD